MPDTETSEAIARPRPPIVPGTPVDLADKNDRLTAALHAAAENLKELQDENARLRSAGIHHTTVLESKNKVNPAAFEKGNVVQVIDENNPWYGQTGLVVEAGRDGMVTAEMRPGKNVKFGIGVEGKARKQVRLCGKDDGTNVVVLIDRKPVEVYGVPGKSVHPGETVKVSLITNQILEIGGVELTGESGVVSKVLGDGSIEIGTGYTKRVVRCRAGIDFEAGDRVCLDPNGLVVVRKLPRETDGDYSVADHKPVSWEDVGGQAEAIAELRQAVEWPILHSDHFKFYGTEPPAGLLMHGSPGNGKTLLARAVYTSISKLHGATEFKGDGFILVSGPQLLVKWVGDSEAGVRDIFDRSDRYSQKTGRPGVIAIDEADAILGRRGEGRPGGDMRETMVPQFLAKLDGVNKTKGIVLLMTNRPNSLDEGVIREGRVERHIKITRPTRQTAPEVLGIYLRDCPLKGTDAAEVIGKVLESVYDQGRVVYGVQTTTGEKFRMTFGDVVSGATFAAIPKRAKSLSMVRSVSSGKPPEGVRLEDFLKAVEIVYGSRESVDDRYAQAEWLEAKGMQKENVKFTNVVVKK